MSSELKFKNPNGINTNRRLPSTFNPSVTKKKTFVDVYMFDTVHGMTNFYMFIFNFMSILYNIKLLTERALRF